MTKHISPTLTSTRSLIALSLLAFASLAQASILQDDFNDYVNDAAFVPASFPSGSPAWTNNGSSTGENYTRVTSTSAESAFTNDVGGLGVLLTDSSTSLGSSGGIKTTFADVDGDSTLTLSFDYIVYDIGDNSLSLTTIMNEGVGGRGSYFVFWNGTTFDSESGTAGFGYQTNAGKTDLGTVALNTWYHVELSYNMSSSTSDNFDISITPFGGSTTTFENNPFRASTGTMNSLYFLSNANETATGSWAIDNVSLVPEKSTTAAVFGLGALMAVFVYRRRALKR